jgi:P-type E1-E2 ATPase
LLSKSAWEIKIGDVVKLLDTTIFPADFMLLSTSSAGEAFIKTSSLDGEKNLKKRVQARDFDKVVVNDDEDKSIEMICKINNNLEVEPANKNLHSLKGVLN